MALGRTVAELHASMQPAEFLAWYRFDAESPLPDRRLDLLFAMQTAALMNGLVRREDGKAWRPGDFLMFDRPPEAAGPALDLADRLRAAFAQHNESIGP